jgi:hypothetical protein
VGSVRAGRGGGRGGGGGGAAGPPELDVISGSVRGLGAVSRSMLH